MGRSRSLSVAALLCAFFAAKGARADDRVPCSEAYQSAQRLRAAGHLRASREDLLTCVRLTCPAFVHADCTTWLSEVEAAIPTLVFAALDETGHDLVGGSILVDGSLLPDALDGRAHPLDPGPHTIRLEGRGGRVETQIVVRSGEQGRRLELRLPAPKTVTVSVPLVATRPVPVGVYLLGGASLALAGTGTAFWIVGSRAARTYNGACESSRCGADERATVQRELVVGDVLWAVGLVAAGAATYFFLARPAHSAVVGAAPLPGGAALSMHVIF
jgi:hypothetical protein